MTGVSGRNPAGAAGLVRPPLWRRIAVRRTKSGETSVLLIGTDCCLSYRALREGSFLLQRWVGKAHVQRVSLEVDDSYVGRAPSLL